MLLNCRFFSPVLRRNTQVNVVVATPEEENRKVKKNQKVLYLLHGLHGDAASWLHFSNIERYARDFDLTVVMPDAGNSFYQDMAHGERFFTYISKELPAFIRGLLPVSDKREDTFIAGLSMGGYGAFYLGLSCPEQYSAAASFSGALDVGFRYAKPLTFGGAQPFYAENCFGDPASVAGSDRDIFTLYQKAAKAGTVPRLYQSCGTADYLYEMNRAAYENLTRMGADITYRETPGVDHCWDFWDSEIRYVLNNWLFEA